ncbi:MAG: CDP-alcohol phosphatidyltransferase family protein [Actinobacteria bacterium]|nr:CDP-alcohol phosphatidyltransferase family protein [Actinomycetota bacterium]
MQDYKEASAAVPSQSQPQPIHDLSRLATLPNLITAVRIACIPVFLQLTLVSHRLVAGAILLAALGATDWVDGQVARRFNQVSSAGKILDPTADRLLVVAGIVAAIWTGAVPYWLVVVVLSREIIVSLAVVILAAIGADHIDVLVVGKAGTFAIMVAIPAFLISHGGASWQEPFHMIAWIAAAGGIVLGWIAVGAYVPAAKKALSTRKKRLTR